MQNKMISSLDKDSVMTKQKKLKFHKIDHNLYRVSGAVRRSAATGRYVVDRASIQDAEKMTKKS